MNAVHEGDPRTGSYSGKKIGNGLVLAEIALAFGLLVVSGLMIKDLILLQNRDSGMRVDHVLAFDLSPDGRRYQEESAVMEFYHNFYSRLIQAKGITSAGLTSHLPMYRYGVNGEIQIEGGTPWEAKDAPLVEMRWLYGDYLKTIGVPLLRGRTLDARDGKGTHTALINRAMAEKFWPGKDPLGRKFWLSTDSSQWSEVVGVVGNIRSFGLAYDARCEYYRPIDQSPFFDEMTMVIRVDQDEPKTIIPAVRQILASVDPTMPLSNAQTLEDIVSASVGSSRLMSALTGLFGCLAGLISMMGIYSVTAYNVRRQRREFGVRIAMGAEQIDIVKLMVGRGLLLALAGIIIGAIGARLLTGLLKAMIHDVKYTDPMIFAGTAAAVLAIVLLASYLPARSAARVDPVVVLRNE